MDDIATLSYEAAYQQLEALVAQLESGALPLEDSVKLYERSQRLARPLPGAAGRGGTQD